MTAPGRMGDPPAAGRDAEAPRALVSVVTPFLNGAAYLAEAVESVRAQTYPHWELLLVDDGSADASTAIAREAAARDPTRVRYLEHPGHANRGMSASRNAGIAAARGELVAFLDADDVWEPRKLEEQVALLDAHPGADATYGNTLFWYGWTGRAEDARRDHLPPLGVVPDGALAEPPALLALMLRSRVAVPCTCSVVARAAAVRRAGGFEERFRGMHEDQAFYVKLFLSARVLVVHRWWERYRQHPDSCTAAAARAGEVRAAHRRFLAWAREYLGAQGVRDRRVWRALAYAEWRCEHPELAEVVPRARRAFRRLRAAARRRVFGPARHGAAGHGAAGQGAAP